MRVLFDINILLDLLLNREPWARDARALEGLVLKGEIDGYVAAASFGTIHFLITKQADREVAMNCVEQCLALFKVARIDGEVIEAAAALRGRDFEDDVQIATAVATGIDFIATRDDRTGFAHSAIPVADASDLLQRVKRVS